MEKKTKFKIGSEIWIIKAHKIQKVRVKAICLTSNGVCYLDSEYNFINDAVPESLCFESKEALIENLTKD